MSSSDQRLLLHPLARRWLGLLMLCCGWLLGSCQQSSGPIQGHNPAMWQAQPIIGGKIDLRYPAVGAMVDGGGRPFCTGTLIASRVVLTAAHCVDGKTQGRLLFRIDLPAASGSGYTPNYFEFDNQYIAAHPGWTGNLSAAHDIAIAVLKKPVPSTVATPLPFHTAPLTSAWIGKDITFLGYGLIQSVPAAVNPDTKHGAVIPLIEIFPEIFMVYSQQTNICHGDSGGPGLAMINGQITVLGVNSFSTSALVPGSNPARTRCDQRSGITRVDVYARFVRSWLDRFGDAPAACANDQECTSCESCDLTAGSPLCQRKSSLRDKAFCQPCSSQQECGGSLVCHRLDEGLRCMQRCPSDGCCPDGASCVRLIPTGSTEQDWFCVPKGRRCPPVACQTAQECGPGELCQSGTCAPARPARAPKLCHPCKSHDECNDATHKDRLCLGPAGQGFCTQGCGMSDFCPSGLACQQPYLGVPKQCIPDESSCRIDCATDQECPTNFVCQARVCTRKDGGEQGDLCDPMPCRVGLLCVATASGKRCMRPCGAPPGSPGGPCLPDETCIGAALCQSVTTTTNACIQPCKTNADCLGAPCKEGLCRCTKDDDCDKDAYCNDDAKFIPSCVLRKDKGTCDTGWRCTPHRGFSLCIADGPGHVALGQACDAVNRCRSGLLCITGLNGRRCLEDCTASRSCKLGGFCSAEKDGVAVCLCRNDANCPKGRVCAPAFHLDLGYCAGHLQTTTCIDERDCPTATICEKGTCVPAPPPQEPAPEPTSEPVQEPASEPISEVHIDEATAQDASPPTPELRQEPSQEFSSPIDVRGELGEPGLERPSGGCQCHSSQAATSPPSPLCLLLLLLLWRYRRA